MDIIISLKAEIFDIIATQEQVRAQFDRLEQYKQQKLKELQEQQEDQTPATPEDKVNIP